MPLIGILQFLPLWGNPRLHGTRKTSKSISCGGKKSIVSYKFLQRDYGEFISFNQINTFRVLLANKEEHLFHTMKIHQRQDSLLLEQLPLVTEQATSFRTVTRKKKGIAGFFGAKETVQVPMQSNLLHALNRQLISRQQQISDNTDSLCVQNKELNSKLSTLLQELDEQSQTAFQNKEQHIKRIV